MRNKYQSLAILGFAAAMLLVYSCTKNQVNPSADSSAVQSPQHTYGVLTATPDMYANVPQFDMASFVAEHAINATGSNPVTVTLATPAIRDQGQLGSCTSFCGAEAYEIGYNYKYGSFPTVVSPAFIYYEERVNILGEKITADNGAYMVNIGQALQKYGVCTEALYAYPSSDKSTAYKTPPSASAISNALGFKVTKATMVATGDTGAVKTLLRANIPVMMGLNVYDNTRTYQYFEALNTTSNTYNPLTTTGALAKGVTLLGGHATPIVGYDDTKKAFLVQNSWGSSWGKAGFYYMPYTVFMSTKIVPAGGVFYLTL